MPGFDGTGPMGAGSMTGGGRGYCAAPGAAAQPVYGGRGFGRGYGFGRGFGAGFGRGRGYGGRGFGRAGGYPAWGNAPRYDAPYPMNPADELSMLKAQADSMKTALDNILKRMAELDKTAET